MAPNEAVLDNKDLRGIPGKEKLFPVDIWSLRKVGLETWYENYSSWPVSAWELHDIWHDIYDHYGNIMQEASEFESDILAILVKLISEYLMFFHSALLFHRLKEQKISPYPSQDEVTVNYFDCLLHGATEFQGAYNLKRRKSWWYEPTFKERLREKVRCSIKNLISLASKPSKKTEVWWSIDQPRKYLDEYAKLQNKKFRFISIDAISKKPKSDNFCQRFDAGKTTSKIMNGLSQIHQKYELELDSENFNCLAKMTRDCLVEVADGVSQFRSFLKNKKPTTILASQLGGVRIRSFCMAAKRLGFEIVGATHGSNIGGNTGGASGYLDFLIADTYVVPIDNSVKLFQQNLDTLPILKGKESKIVSIRSNNFKKIWDENRKKTLPTAIQKIMFIEYPLSDHIHQGMALFWPYQLKLLLDAVSVSKKNGKKVFLQRHPDRLKESQGLYETFFDHCPQGSFEENWRFADAFVFTNLNTTTFAFALLTNRPIIFFEVLLENLSLSVHKSLSQRCHIVPSKFNQSGDLVFDQQDFQRAINEVPKEPDMEFIKKNMIQAV